MGLVKGGSRWGVAVKRECGDSSPVSSHGKVILDGGRATVYNKTESLEVGNS